MNPPKLGSAVGDTVGFYLTVTELSGKRWSAKRGKILSLSDNHAVILTNSGKTVELSKSSFWEVPKRRKSK